MAEATAKRSKRTPAIEQAILDALAAGRSLRSICAEVGITAAAFTQWMYQDEALASSYARAREACGDLYETEIIEISDEAAELALIEGSGSAAVQAAKLRADNRKWVLERMRQGRWGAKGSMELSGPAGGPIAHSITVEMVPVIAAGAAQRVIEAQASESEED